MTYDLEQREYCLFYDQSTSKKPIFLANQLRKK